jgi:hypothetical protein
MAANSDAVRSRCGGGFSFCFGFWCGRGGRRGGGCGSWCGRDGRVVVPAMPATVVVLAMPAFMAALDGSVVDAGVLSGAAGVAVGGGHCG